MKMIEVIITACIPVGNDELGHDAIVATRGPAETVVDILTKLGLQDVKQKRRLTVKRPRGEVEALVYPERSFASALD